MYLHKNIKNPIAVLGSGSWGTALSILLASNHQVVRLWGHDAEHIQEMRDMRSNERYLPGIHFPDLLELVDDLSEALDGVRDILIVVPSHVFIELLIKLKTLLMPDARIVWGTKGMVLGTGQLLHDATSQILGQQYSTAAIAGPSFAKEVALGKPTAITIATLDHSFAQSLIARLNSNTFRVYSSTDIIGVEVCGVVKNILAIAAGVVDGLSLGANALSALITRGLAEMQRLGIRLGGQPSTFQGLAGMGDLILSCTDNQSRNRRFGKAIAEGKSQEDAIKEIGQVVEGLSNLKTVYHLAQTLSVEMPITEQVYYVIYEGLSAQSAIQNLFTRQTKSELD
jgi:glycerol-3-phosphate dehydrogenase (NAD(P)+)